MQKALQVQLLIGKLYLKSFIRILLNNIHSNNLIKKDRVFDYTAKRVHTTGCQALADLGFIR